MKITRRTSVLIKTERKFLVRQKTGSESVGCGYCGEPMISAQMSADFFGFSSRVIYRLIEADKIHYVETGSNEIYICPASVNRALETLC